MIQKSWIILILLSLVGGLIFFLRTYLGDFRPALLPPKKDIAEIIKEKNIQRKQGKPVDFPLNLPEGFNISIFARHLSKPRDLVFSPAGTLLVSLPSRGEVVALPDKNGDGQADEKKVVLSGLNKPHGLAFYQGQLFVAEETRVVRYFWDEEELKTAIDKKLFSLPAGGRHTTRTLAFDKKGNMFVSLGSTCDVCFEDHRWLAAVIKSDKDGNNPHLFAKGLRNSVFIVVNPATDELWGTEMGRDFLGDFLPPDEINIIREGNDYGWPVCYGNKVYDKKFGYQDPAYCQKTQSPIYEIAAHSAPLGLVFIDSPQFPDDWQGDLLVAYHGSWNRSTPIGYKVVHMKVKGNKILGEEDFISGFLTDSQALGRPVDMTFDREGNLYLSDDKAGVVYLINKN